MNSWFRHCKWNKLWLPGRLSRKYLLLICRSWLPIPRWEMSAIKSHLDYARYKTRNCWRSMDAHFQDGAGSELLPLLPIKDANTSIVCIHYQLMFLSRNLLDQKLLTLTWRSFSRWVRERFAFSFPYKECQHFHYVYSLPDCVFITQLTAPTIVDAPLTLILPWADPQYTIISFGGIYH